MMTITSEQRRAIEYCTGVPVDTYGWEIKDIIPIPNSSEHIAYIKHEATDIYFHVPLSEIIIGEKEATYFLQKGEAMLLREMVEIIDGLTMEELDTIAQAVEDRREGLMESLACEVAAKTEEMKFFQQELDDMRVEYLGAKAISDRIKLNTLQPVNEEQLDTSHMGEREVCNV